MKKEDKSPIEKRLSETLQRTHTQPSNRVKANILAHVRQQKAARTNIFNYNIPLWQVAALLLLALGVHYLFPNTVIEENTIVQTKIQPEYIYQTDTITQIKNIEKIVYRNVPVEVIKYVEIPVPMNNNLLITNTKADTSLDIVDVSSKNKKKASPTVSRNIRQDEDIMNFVVENQPLNSFTNYLSDK